MIEDKKLWRLIGYPAKKPTRTTFTFTTIPALEWEFGAVVDTRDGRRVMIAPINDAMARAMRVVEGDYRPWWAMVLTEPDIGKMIFLSPRAEGLRIVRSPEEDS